MSSSLGLLGDFCGLVVEWCKTYFERLLTIPVRETLLIEADFRSQRIGQGRIVLGRSRLQTPLCRFHRS